MKARHLNLLVLVCVTSALVVPSARAATAGDAPAVVSPATLASSAAAARLHFQQGVALYQDRNYDAALAEFLGAYGISHEPVVLYNLGLTYKALFRYSEAVDALDRYLGESGPKISKERRLDVERVVSELKSLLADVTIVVRPADAAVVVDGRAVTLGIEGIVKLSPGTHVVEASARGYTGDKRALTVVAGTPQTLSLVLAEIPHTARIKIAATQLGARVAIDGKDVGSSPVEVELAVGGHQVEVSAPGYAPDRSELTVAAGQSRTVTVTLESPRAEPDTRPLYRRWWLWAGVGVVAAAAVTIAVWPRSTQGPIIGSLGIGNSNGAP
ncbi:MAG TPA: PEGA domain-containing protein [Polyangia bacterium]|jgi:hypothetical protein|nr:PEGA domain-containing protein [Polyangia bacterium]